MKLGEAREILGLGPDATPEDARIAYRKLALTEHPSRAIGRKRRFSDGFETVAPMEVGDCGSGLRRGCATRVAMLRLQNYVNGASVQSSSLSSGKE